MTSIVPGGQAGSVGGSATNKAGILAQLDAMADAMRQLVGDARMVRGSGAPTNPLNGPFELYFDWDRGSDIFVTGEYNSFESTGTEEEQIAAKINRMSRQQLAAGYTKARPFKTLNRAVLEAVIITSRNYYTFSDPRAHRDCVIIHPAPGPQPIFNHPGSHQAAIPITAWADGFIPTWQHLIAFNNNAIGSVVLPRGASMPGPELRKCNFIPQWAPPDQDYASDWSNVRTVISLTPDNHTTDFTFRDPPGTGSLHLLKCIGYASEAELDEFYDKAFTAVGAGANLSETLTSARRSEYEVVGPIDGTPSLAWDTVKGSSAYPERVSYRSERGMGGLFIDGNKLQGLKSTVTAQFTGTCLQTVLTSWQIYSAGNWITPPSYDALIAAQPDDRRMRPGKWSIHILAINGAFVSDVSVFGIGHGVKSLADLGADITSTNGNFTFGSCAGLARGYKPEAFPQDRNWALSRIKAPLSPGDRTPNVRSISLGRVAAVTSSTITLVAALEPSEVASSPAILAQDGYSLSGGNYIWVENPTGPDYRAVLTNSAWDGAAGATINITAQLLDADTNAPVPLEGGVSVAVGKRVYIRRLIDNRSTAQRRVTLELNNTSDCRLPIRSQVVQLNPTVSGGQVTRELAPGGAEVLQLTQVRGGTVFGSGVTRTASVTLRRSAASVNYGQGVFYRRGTVVKALNKHWIALKDLTSSGAAPNPALWGETFVHMPEQYNAPDNADNEAPLLVFDIDTDPANVTTTCGINWSTIFTTAGPVRERFRTGVDALGAYAFLRAMGFSDAASWAALTPRAESARLLDPSSATDFPTAPSGGAAAGRGNWALEFRRSSTVALLTHTWDLGAGRGNYSTALLAAQKTISPQNLFSLLFTNETGGRMIVGGTNEDGFRVSPRGLEDNETGELTNPIDIGGGDDNLPTTLNDLSVDNLTITGRLDGSGISDFVGLAASTTRPGLSEIATQEEVEQAFLGLPTGDPDTDGMARVLDLNGITRLRALVLNSVRLLETKFTRLYVDGEVTVTTGVDLLGQPTRTVGNIPLALWEDMQWQRSVHELADFDPTAPSASAQALANVVVFRSHDEAFSFLAGRSALDASASIVINFYRSSRYRGGPQSYGGLSGLVLQRGPSFNPPAAGNDRSLDRRAGTIWLEGSSITLGPADSGTANGLCDLEIHSGFSANPLQLTSQDFLVRSSPDTELAGTLEVWNCGLTLRTTVANAAQVIHCDQFLPFTRRSNLSPGNRLTGNASIDIALQNVLGNQNGVINFDAAVRCTRVSIQARRGATGFGTANYPLIGSRNFNLALSADYSGYSVNNNRKPFYMFAILRSFNYDSRVGGGTTQATTEAAGVRFNVSLVNWQANTFYFAGVLFDRKNAEFTFREPLIPVGTDVTWTNLADKQTKATWTDNLAGTRTVNLRAFQGIKCDADGIRVGSLEAPPNNDLTNTRWGTLSSQLTLAARAAYPNTGVPASDATHQIVAWGPGSVVANQFKPTGGWFNIWNLTTENLV